MAKYQKKPVVIEAFKFGHDPIPDWFMDKVSTNAIVMHGQFREAPSHCEIATLEGVMTASNGDFVIQGVKGEIYPCKPDIFEATYGPPESHSLDEYREALRIVCKRIAEAHRAAGPLLAAARSNERANLTSGPLRPLTTFMNPLIRAMLEAHDGYQPRRPLDGLDSPEANS